MDKKDTFKEYICKECDAVFFRLTQFNSHKGTHVKGTKPKCRICKVDLKENFNWMPSMVKACSRICKKCKRVKNKTIYRERKRKQMEKVRGKK